MSVKKTYRMDEDTANKIAQYANDKRITQERAFCELVGAGWVQNYQEELANPLLAVFRSHLHSLEKVIVGDVERCLDEVAARLFREALELRREVLALAILTGSDYDEAERKDAHAQADKLLGLR